METPEQDAAHMARAVELAGHGHGSTSPNPVVGCVVLDAAGQVAGEGFHAYAGGPHAEVAALAQAGERARGGTAYVTLEPCDHTGRTGPCSRALLDAGVARVVIAVTDPNPKAAGGAARLRAHGVSVTSGVLAGAAERGNEEWLTYARLGRSHVTWKFAATLDGRSAAEDGTSQWITSPEARADVHRMRAAADAIVAGIGTVLADDPGLTARVRDGSGRTPLRVVIDTEGHTPQHARVLDDKAPTLVAVAEDARTPLKADLLRLPRHEGGLDLGALLRELAAREVVGVFLEGGPTLAGSFVRQGLADRVLAYVAPALLGSGKAALGAAGVGTIGDVHRLTFDDFSLIGPDLRLIARPAHPSSREQ
ncbi:bifunctional diaminohydroxyphosphoribosylaminopyrimidine deaminase/5-amino-6-(5-phosphoribosylamino)uracil reductase RibD [Nonomuraea sp. KC401]|uniref:bifunctional diaminohydroxyphosphoribosylaminopyrimidine deaminase/5-amino-6-(5-phosphoribosylamino)uracil reductase RibD n=1 Tax=unclassified Nonomuraea TaxID=2593643 RepID=UPI0010FD663C|nr:bifunctional diaminohydroxyphosphoribosylaminopyrimidine deaminase/5-amino-6-(5-phosphoribosylamino)uracil reductase RibD [Nonomuraea sp. KC401]NBE99524.1 bifunctional diaminohydroxyphosphoribosylaminopyrimidine deaminase/5-amino-6-(5-phosphoribosylamino)uracil reductase RibD [Nonomuraea sp. K271]TLF57128.1 bifunctional diaminohydroxyphosphoribosylaminopyrimidine deaminase/5-amino-6-(5-phosphoribosylamino)uracil reductase RibD [Nonomuraea sp. KC401]